MQQATSSAGPRPEWANAPIRIDPTFLDRRQILETTDGGEPVVYRIDKRGVAIQRRLERADLPMTIALPPTAFQGVAARAMEAEDGVVTVTLELLHADPKFCVPLLVATDLFDVAADWRGWSEMFHLPMLMIEADGSVSALEDTLGGVRSNGPAPRRAGASGSRHRRPRFLARRKPGGLGLRMIVAGEEIVARD
ncbi:hypothetical protein GCM10011390_37160 [Aureimonas endophytica]|uniref:Uncharacterized protein n=1 Tax=Aureimonas endophytica TaxID=2027858 RepID=A0A916ZUB0_9HYPH|nr:DUF6101 family protein [Aureimonas endophytica]GGE14597.1 hypothetical protein GCM10011390_37160 [Aureimonas endophytica]